LKAFGSQRLRLYDGLSAVSTSAFGGEPGGKPCAVMKIIASLKRIEPALRATGVDALYLFGSGARDESRSESDVDVFVDPKSDERFGFLQYMDAYETIQKALGDSVAIGYSTRNGLSRYVRPEIEKEAIRVF
jgi:predicted nucleotidyltransferase